MVIIDNRAPGVETLRYRDLVRRDVFEFVNSSEVRPHLVLDRKAWNGHLECANLATGEITSVSPDHPVRRLKVSLHIEGEG